MSNGCSKRCTKSSATKPVAYGSDSERSPKMFSRSLTVEEIVRGSESGVLDGVVRDKGDPHGASGRLDGPRIASSAEATEQCREAVQTVAKFHEVIRTIVGRLDVKFAEEVDANALARWRYSRETSVRSRIG